jgi:hypothetical protein
VGCAPTVSWKMRLGARGGAQLMWREAVTGMRAGCSLGSGPCAGEEDLAVSEVFFVSGLMVHGGGVP